MATKSKIPSKAPALRAKPAPKKVVKKIPVQSAKPSGTSPSSRKGAPAGKKIPAAAKRSKPGSAKPGSSGKKPPILPGVPLSKPRVVLTGFLAKQRNRLLMLKDTLLDSMNGVAKDSLRSRADGSEASAFGMHQADAGSDAYDRDFALSLLSQEQDSLYEIDEALKRVESGSYGICEISSKAIPHIRLEALPFTRYTVECQAEIEKRARFSRVRQPITSLFGLGDDEGTESDDDDSSNDSKD